MRLLRKLVKKVPGSHAAYALISGTVSWLRVTRQFHCFRVRSLRERPALVPLWSERQFFLGNRTAQTPFDRHYVYHTAWAVRQLQRHRPDEHVDISSSVYFIALGTAIVPMVHIDYRPPALVLDKLKCAQGDLLSLPFPDDSVRSLSCMHVIEHIGLARYGDALDPLGDVKAANELMRVLATGGRLYLVAPVGRRRVCFNGHRIYDFGSVRALFPALKLEEWALIPDNPAEGLVLNAPSTVIDSQQYGCGCFVFRKPEHFAAVSAPTAA